MGKGIGILVNDGYAYKITAPSEVFADGVLDLNALGSGDSAYQVWLGAGNVGTVTDFLADVGGLVVNDVMATYSIDQMAANKSFNYANDLLTSIVLNVNASDKYTITFTYDVDNILQDKTITRIDAKWVKYTFSYTDGAITSTTVTAG